RSLFTGALSLLGERRNRFTLVTISDWPNSNTDWRYLKLKEGLIQVNTKRMRDLTKSVAAFSLIAGLALAGEKPTSRHLLGAVQSGDIADVKRLLDLGAEVNASNSAGATALMWAIPNTDLVKLLVSRGANVNARSTNLGRTPFLIAASYPGTTTLL